MLGLNAKYNMGTDWDHVPAVMLFLSNFADSGAESA
jgi:hypothetical protein